MEEKELSQLTDTEALLKIATMVSEGGLGIRSIGAAGRFSDPDGKTRRHFTLEVAMDLLETNA
jgi:hypothetical protein